MHLYEERSTKVEEQGLQALSATIRLHPDDDVVIARHHVPEGTPVAEEDVVAADLIPAGHKMTTRGIASGQPVRRFTFFSIPDPFVSYRIAASSYWPRFSP